MKKVFVLCLVLVMIVGCGGKNNNGSTKPGGSSGNKLVCSLKEDGFDQSMELTYSGDKATYATMISEMDVEPETATFMKELMVPVFSYFDNIRGIDVSVDLLKDNTKLAIVMNIDIKNLDYEALAALSGQTMDQAATIRALNEAKDLQSYKAEMEAEGWTCH